MTLPLFGKLPASYKQAYDKFFDVTHPDKIHSHPRDLTLMVALAEKVEYVLERANPFWDTVDKPLDAGSIRAHQWHLTQLSFVKWRLAQAILHKRDYYKNAWIGRITKLILRLFCVWNNGNTAAIRRAEEFLFRYDSRYPIYKSKPCSFWLLIPHTWINQSLDVQHFYNYDSPARAIEVQGGNNAGMPRFMVAVN